MEHEGEDLGEEEDLEGDEDSEDDVVDEVAWDEGEIWDDVTGEVQIVKHEVTGTEKEFDEFVIQAVSKSERHELSMKCYRNRLFDIAARFVSTYPKQCLCFRHLTPWCYRRRTRT